MSKRIMNEVICCAEDLGFPVYYQDTDSIHIHQMNLTQLADEYRKRYGRELIGKQLGQFHSDFATFGTSSRMPVAIRSIFCAKKTYTDQLQNSSGEIAFHIRMKGVPSDVIVKRANELFPKAIQCEYLNGLAFPVPSVSDNEDYSVWLLYKSIYDGNAVSFDLCESSHPSFELKNFRVSTRTHFIREISI